MTSTDKAAIGWTIGIVALFVAIAFATSPGQDSDLSEQIQSQAEEREAAIEEQLQMESEPEPMMEEPIMEEPIMEEPMMEEPSALAGPQTVTVTLPAGTSVPGCEETNECFIPESITINAGDTVSWENTDTAAHTVTSGTAANGPDGTFDSSLLMGGATFEVTFDESGSNDYFCMVHPWMVGNVQVN